MLFFNVFDTLLNHLSSFLEDRFSSFCAEKEDYSYLDAITYIRTIINLALLRSAIICLIGCRGSKRPTDIDSSCSAIMRKGSLDS